MVTNMKIPVTTLLIIFVMATIGYGQQPQNTRTQMMLDSKVSGKNVTIVRPKEAARPAESITEFKELSTIMRCDIDAMQRIPSKAVVYVKPGEVVRPSEKRR
jgi:hypothetical protein